MINILTQWIFTIIPYSKEFQVANPALWRSARLFVAVPRPIPNCPIVDRHDLRIVTNIVSCIIWRHGVDFLLNQKRSVLRRWIPTCSKSISAFNNAGNGEVISKRTVIFCADLPSHDISCCCPLRSPFLRIIFVCISLVHNFFVD